MRYNLYSIIQKYTSFLSSHMFIDDTVPFIIKGWNKSFIYFRNRTTIESIFYSSVVTRFNFDVLMFKRAFFFFYIAMLEKRNCTVLFIGSKKVPLFLDIFDKKRKSQLNSNIYGIDKWFNGFLTVKRSFFQYYKFLKKFSNEFVDVHSYMSVSTKEFDLFRNMIITFFKKPSFIFFMHNVKSSYLAGKEIYKFNIPTIAIVSPESRSFGFSEMTFTIPYPFSDFDKYEYLKDLYLILLSFTNKLLLFNHFFELSKIESKNYIISDFENIYKDYCLIYKKLQTKQKILSKFFFKNENDILFDKEIDFSLVKEYKILLHSNYKMRYYIAFFMNIISMFFFFCFSKGLGSLYYNENNIYIYKRHFLYQPFIRLLQFLKLYKIKIFQYQTDVFRILKNFKKYGDQRVNLVDKILKLNTNLYPLNMFSIRRLKLLNDKICLRKKINKLNGRKKKYKRKTISFIKSKS